MKKTGVLLMMLCACTVVSGCGRKAAVARQEETNY